MLSRRTFIRTASVAIGSAILPVVSPGRAYGAGRIGALGVSLFSIPKLLEKDFAATMQMLASTGYKKVELFGPYPFSPDEEKQRWSAITPALGFSGSGFFGLNIEVVKDVLDDNGLSVPSMHAGLLTLKNAMGELAEAATILGADYVTLPSAETQTSLEGYRRQAVEFNAIGREAKKYGVRFAYHNHGNGLKEMEGRIPFDVMMENTDPVLVYYQMDIFWMTAGGIDLVNCLDKYRGRFRLMHIKDMSKDVRFAGDGGDPQQWMELFPYLTNAGSGVLDLKRILYHAQKSGVEHFIVERDLAPSPESDLHQSLQYITSLELKK